MSADVKFEIQIDGTWSDLVKRDQVRAAQSITIKRSAAGIGEAPRPASVAAQLDNTSDDLRPSNPESPIYGTAGVGTQIRVSRGGEVRGYVQAQSWVADETSDFRATPKRGAAWVNVTGAGLLQQAMSGPKLESPFTRYAKARPTLVGLWPCEEQSGATALANLVAGGALGRIFGSPTIGSDERPLGAESSIQTTSGSSLRGTFSAYSGSTSWRIGFQAKLAGAGLTASYNPIFTWYDSAGRRWTWEINNVNHAIRVLDSDAGAISFEVFTRSSELTDWGYFSIYAVVAAGTLTYTAEVFTQAYGGEGIVKTFSSTTTGSLRNFERPDNAYTLDGNYCQIHGLADAGDVGSDTLAFLGHQDEPAAWRFARLMEELGFAWSWVGDPDDSMPMGPQQADTVGEILREIQDSEDGLIFDKRDALEIVMMTRVARINQTAMPVNVRDLTARPREVIDSAIANTVTASNRLGAESVAVDLSGPLGVTAKGVMEDEAKVNVYPDRLLDQLANWYLRRWTVNQPRYPTVSVKLNALDAARQAQLRALDIGDVIELTGVRADTVRVHIVAIDEVVGWPNEHILTFTCEPDDLFNSGVYDTARYDSSSTTLAAVAEIGQTSLSLSTVQRGDVWSTTAVPYPITVSGQRLMVTAMTAASGTGPYTQTATVTPSINGVRKRLSLGAEVHVAVQARYALGEA